MSQITFPNKNTGDTFSATEANEIKTVVNANDTTTAAALATKEATANKNTANGYAGLDTNSRIAKVNSYVLTSTTPINSAIVAGDDPQLVAEKLQGQLNTKVSYSETLIENSLLSVDNNGRLVNSGYEIADLLIDVSRTIIIDIGGNLILGDNAYIYADDVYVKNNNGAKMLALSSDQDNQLLLGGGNLTSGVKTNIFVATSYVKSNVIVSNVGTLSIGNINTASGVMSIGGIVNGATYSLSANIAGTPTCSVMLATCDNSGVGGSGDVLLNPGLPNGGGVGGRVYLFRSNRSVTTTLGIRTVVISSAIQDPTATDIDTAIMFIKDIVAGNAAPHFMTENGSIVRLFQSTGGGVASAGGTYTSTEQAMLQKVYDVLRSTGLLN